MNKQFKTMRFDKNPAFSKGMTLLDVLLAIVIFVVGMLALASLQGNLTRSSADANTRTVGSNIAEELIEGLRTVEEIEIPAGTTCETDLVDMVAQNIYQCIDDATTQNFTRAGNEYDLQATVEDWYIMEDGVSVTNNVDDLPEDWNVTSSSYKFVQISVDWAENAVGFQGADADNDLLGSGAVQVSAIIPSIPNLGSAKVAAGEGDAASVPLVDYIPGARPDIIPINVGTDKFKESETPMPDVIVRDEIVETWFDVVTYNQSATNTFIRREEFVVVSCDCTLRTSGGTGYLPVTWNGKEYTEHDPVPKNYGESANNQQSMYCDTCCRDHHDDPNNLDPDFVYDPWREWTAPSNGAHEHYNRTSQGNQPVSYTLANSDGDNYVEACRMVRKDGFMRVAQDFRQEGLIALPQSYFLSTNNINAYSAYVTGSVEAFVASSAANKTLATPATATPKLVLPGDGHYNSDLLTATDLHLPDFLGATQQQEVSRAIYVDHITDELQAAINCVNGSVTDCEVPPGVGDQLEIIPFYEIQTTWLSFWKEDEEIAPVAVTNDPLSDLNAHSRGLLSLVSSTPGDTQLRNYMHRGNVGLTATDPIDDYWNTGLKEYRMNVFANGGGGTAPAGVSFTGTISSTVGGVKAAQTIMTGEDGVVCNKDAENFDCFLYEGSVMPTITITGFSKSNTVLYVCSSNPDFVITNYSSPQSAVIDLQALIADTADVSLVIQTGGCGG
jgi:type IV pilus modification protein PilV